jgi:DNA-binding response OmpR family regulator
MGWVHSTAPIPPSRVLVVDDDAGWTDLLAEYLRAEEVSVVVANNCDEALVAAKDLQPRIILLDADVRGGDGVQLCRRMRTLSDGHITMLTARSDEDTTIAGLAAGADDVLAKPFTSREIAARIKAIRRRFHASPAAHTIQPYSENAPGRRVFGRLCVDTARREVFVADEQVSLTRTEFEILATLAQRRGAVTTRQEMLDAVWGPRWAGSIANVHVHIGHLRRKLGDDPARPLLVLNVRGIGYRLAV